MGLPDAKVSVERIRGTAFAREILEIAAQILDHRFPIFGSILETGPEIDWRRDYKNDKTSGDIFFRRIPYLDFDAVGDHKWIWELNRHQHLVVLAQAHLLTGRPEYVAEIEAQLESWIAQNPFARGINWASALEVAFRALSWIWVDHLAGDAMRPEVRLTLQNQLWLHARHLESNLSFYFSPNTHLLGEAVALYAIGKAYPKMPGASRFVRSGSRTTEKQLRLQTHPDGSHFEQSTYYQVYALDFFVFYYVLSGRPERIRRRVREMAGYLEALVGPARRLFFCGDDDGGRLFHPYGERDCFARASLATCAGLFHEEVIGFEDFDLHSQACWWLSDDLPNPRARVERFRLFPQSGLITIVRNSLHVLFDAGPFGGGGAGHSHADTLNLLIRSGREVILEDPGTYTYVADRSARDWFRGTSAHNTVTIDGRDQAEPVNPFRWRKKPSVKLNRFLSQSDWSYIDAQCAYRGFVHRRRVLVSGREACFVVDSISGRRGQHVVEQCWNAPDSNAVLVDGERTEEHGWRSEVYGSRVLSRRVKSTKRGSLPIHMAAVILIQNRGLERMEVIAEAASLRISAAGMTAVFPHKGDAFWSRPG